MHMQKSGFLTTRNIYQSQSCLLQGYNSLKIVVQCLCVQNAVVVFLFCFVCFVFLGGGGGWVGVDDVFLFFCFLA